MALSQIRLAPPGIWKGEGILDEVILIDIDVRRPPICELSHHRLLRPARDRRTAFARVRLHRALAAAHERKHDRNAAEREQRVEKPPKPAHVA